MKNPKLFNSSINKLVKAYLNNTLKHGRCNACAVGNILDGFSNWSYLFMTVQEKNGNRYRLPYIENTIIDNGNVRQGQKTLGINDKLAVQRIIARINSFGYKVEELDRVEEAFEMAEGTGDERMFNGLMAVVDVLADIHEIDLDTVEQAREQFGVFKLKLSGPVEVIG